MPRILKEPEGWELSIFRYTLVPVTLDRAMLSRSGVFTWRGSWAAMAGRQEGDTKDQDSCSPELYDPPFIPTMIKEGHRIKSQLGPFYPQSWKVMSLETSLDCKGRVLHKHP